MLLSGDSSIVQSPDCKKSTPIEYHPMGRKIQPCFHPIGVHYLLMGALPNNPGHAYKRSLFGGKDEVLQAIIQRSSSLADPAQGPRDKNRVPYGFNARPQASQGETPNLKWAWPRRSA